MSSIGVDDAVEDLRVHDEGDEVAGRHRDAGADDDLQGEHAVEQGCLAKAAPNVACPPRRRWHKGSIAARPRRLTAMRRAGRRPELLGEKRVHGVQPDSPTVTYPLDVNPSRAPVKNTRRNLPISISSPLVSTADSIGSRLT